MSAYSQFDDKAHVVHSTEDESEVAAANGNKEKYRKCAAIASVALLIGFAIIAFVTMTKDSWMNWDANYGYLETPELFLCSPTPYQAVKEVDSRLDEYVSHVEDNVRRFRRFGSGVQIRRVIRPLSLPPPIGFNFSVDPPLYHDTGARCTWSEFRKKRIAGLEEDGFSFDYQLLDLSNCTDANDCRRFCFKLYKPNDPNLCNYVMFNKADQKASFFAIDPLMPWNITDDPSIDSYTWNCEAMPRCDWYWVRRQKLKSIDVNEKTQNLIGQVRCRDFGACQRLCESHPTCNYVVMPSNTTRYAQSFLYTVPNEELITENYLIDENLDSFQLVCHEGTTPPPVLSPREPSPKIENNNKAQVFDVNNNSTGVDAGSNQTQSSGISVAIASIATPTEATALATTPPVQPVEQNSTQPRRKPHSGRRVHKESGAQAIKSQRLRRAMNEGKNGIRLVPVVRQCSSVGTLKDCQELTSVLVDANNAQCLRIKIEDDETKAGVQLQLYIRQQSNDWTSKGLWLSVRHPSNSDVQEDLFLKPTIRNELEIVSSPEADKSRCTQQAWNETECYKKCWNQIVSNRCDCKILNQDGDNLKLCPTGSREMCAQSTEVKIEAEGCSKQCASECQKFKYTVSMKSTFDDEALAKESNTLLIDVTVAYRHGIKNVNEMLGVIIVLALLAFVYIVSFLYCCFSEK